VLTANWVGQSQPTKIHKFSFQNRPFIPSIMPFSVSKRALIINSLCICRFFYKIQMVKLKIPIESGCLTNLLNSNKKRSDHSYLFKIIIIFSNTLKPWSDTCLINHKNEIVKPYFITLKFNITIFNNINPTLILPSQKRPILLFLRVKRAI